MKKIVLVFYVLSVFFLSSCTQQEEKKDFQKYNQGFRYEKNGWIFLHVEGRPYDRGYQHGYLIAKEYKDAYKCYNDMMIQTMGITMDFIVKEAVKLIKSKIPQEYIDEMQGIADGIAAKGYQTTLDEVIGWNAWNDMAEGWWPSVKSNYASYLPTSIGKKRERCSAMLATGNATKDGKIIISHSSFDDFWNVQWFNIILDIEPTQGNHMLIQIAPGYISSMTDFFISKAGIVGLETAFAGFNGFNINGNPAFVNQRLAMQYANNIDEFIKIISKNNNAGNPAAWLIGDIKTNEIAKLELGLTFQSVERKKNGYFYGCNVAFDPYIRNLECNGEGFNDIRRHTGGRKVRLPQLLEKHFGQIDTENTKKIMSDHYDVYHKKNIPAANTVCAHYDNDPRYSMSSTAAIHPDPYTPAGAVDCKITTSDMAKDMKLLAIFGRPCGRAFYAKKFLKKHPQWNWQKGYIHERPSQKWSEFSAK